MFQSGSENLSAAGAEPVAFFGSTQIFFIHPKKMQKNSPWALYIFNYFCFLQQILIQLKKLLLCQLFGLPKY
jgi:hypothetical protein